MNHTPIVWGKIIAGWRDENTPHLSNTSIVTGPLFNPDEMQGNSILLHAGNQIYNGFLAHQQSLGTKVVSPPDLDRLNRELTSSDISPRQDAQVASCYGFMILAQGDYRRAQDFIEGLLDRSPCFEPLHFAQIAAALLQGTYSDLNETEHIVQTLKVMASIDAVDWTRWQRVDAALCLKIEALLFTRQLEDAADIIPRLSSANVQPKYLYWTAYHFHRGDPGGALIHGFDSLYRIPRGQEPDYLMDLRFFPILVDASIQIAKQHSDSDCLRRTRDALGMALEAHPQNTGNWRLRDLFRRVREALEGWASRSHLSEPPDPPSERRVIPFGRRTQKDE